MSESKTLPLLATTCKNNVLNITINRHQQNRFNQSLYFELTADAIDNGNNSTHHNKK